MRYIAILAALLLVGVVGAMPWGYFVNESNMSQIYGIVPDAQRVIEAATPHGGDTWEINATTYWKAHNNMQWHMKPYPTVLHFKGAEATISHITITDAGDHYLIGVTRA